MTDPLPTLYFHGVKSPTAHLELVLQLSVGKADDAVGSITPMVAALVQAGQLGGFPLPTASSERSRLDLVSAPRASGSPLSYALDAQYVDPRAFQILRQMVGAFPAQGWAAASITVREAGPVTGKPVEQPVPDDDNEDDVYPGVTALASFTIDWSEDTPPSWSRRCLVEFVSPVQADRVSAVAARVRAWWPLVAAKGFALPTGFPLEEVESFLGGVTQFDEVTVEIAVDRFQASETAWHVLANLLDAYSRTTAAIAKVIVE